MSWIRFGGVFRAVVQPVDLRDAAHLLGAQGLEISHAFEPHGMSFAVLGRGVRVAMHTWPEYQVLTVDVYSREVIPVASCLSGLGWVPIRQEQPK